MKCMKFRKKKVSESNSNFIIFDDDISENRLIMLEYTIFGKSMAKLTVHSFFCCFPFRLSYGLISALFVENY